MSPHARWRAEGELPTLRQLDELVDLVRTARGLYVRFSEGPDREDLGGSVDYESGLAMPGLSTNPLDPQPWWTRPIADWVARQVCQYLHLAERSPDHHGWVLRGTVVGAGPDNEPLLDDPDPVCHLDDQLMREADQWYRAHFDRGRDGR